MSSLNPSIPDDPVACWEAGDMQEARETISDELRDASKNLTDLSEQERILLKHLEPAHVGIALSEGKEAERYAEMDIFLHGYVRQGRKRAAGDPLKKPAVSTCILLEQNVIDHLFQILSHEEQNAVVAYIYAERQFQLNHLLEELGLGEECYAMHKRIRRLQKAYRRFVQLRLRDPQ